MPIIEFFRDENEEIPVVSEKEVSYRKKGPYKKDFIQILNDLPEYIVEHYLTLLKLEKELQTKNKGNIYKNR